MKFSEKRTYILNGEMIFITKDKKVQKDIKKGIEEHHLVTFKNLVTNNEMTVKDEQLKDAQKTIDSTEFYSMWCHFNNWREKDWEYAEKHAIKVIHLLADRKIEMHGSNKFEQFDLNKLCNILDDVYHDTCQPHKIEYFIDEYDGGYTYHVLMTDEEREDADKKAEFAKILKEEITKEINREVMEMLKYDRQI